LEAVLAFEPVMLEQEVAELVGDAEAGAALTSAAD
jgi:hypothetical protein